MKAQVWNVAAIVVGVIVLAMGGPWLVNQVRTLPRSGTLAARADQRVITLEVAGMTCSGCAAAVQSEIASVGGVTAVDVRLAQERAYVVCDRSVADSTLTAAVGRAGPGFLAGVVTR